MKELDKAIKLAKEMAEEYKFKSNPNRKYPCFDSEEKRIKCQKRGEQYEQLAEWLKDYERLKEQESCEDAISRADVLDLCDSKDAEYEVKHFKEDVECLPSVRPEPKTGRWIFTKTKLDRYGCTAECDSCHKKWKTYDEIRFKKEHNYCPNCGCCMVEPQESEG